jgi:hypothetical protein
MKYLRKFLGWGKNGKVENKIKTYLTVVKTIPTHALFIN